MQQHNEVQGSPEWLALRKEYRTASNAAAMLGKNSYKTRKQMMAEDKTGKVKEVSDFTQNLFDRGHDTEAKARDIIERREFVKLETPVLSDVVEGLKLLASFDGLCDEFAFEHKLFNEKLRYEIPQEYKYQLEQQLLISGAPYVLFVSSDGTEENWIEHKYFPDLFIRKELIDGWKQYEKDLAAFEPSNEIDLTEHGFFASYARDMKKCLDEIAELEDRVKWFKKSMEEIAHGDNVICGDLKMFKTERDGSISYAKAIKELLPDADLSKYKGKPTSYYTFKYQGE